ncbi:MAG: ABC transporter permease [Coriobacteriia bacterium]|nr:ABC transporter permease [Coriobacteriia bacterium]
MVSAIRRLAQRKLQTTLTVLGVAVGAAIFVMMGGMGVNAAGVMDQLLDYHGDKVYVVNAEGVSSLMTGSIEHPLTAAMVDDLEAVDGVEMVLCAAAVGYDDEGVLQGIPYMIFGGTTGSGDKREGFWGRWEIGEGRAFEESETGVAVAGVDMLAHLDAKVGDTVTVRGHRIEIVGSMKRLGWPSLDQCLMLPVRDARVMTVESLPPTLRKLDPDDMTMQAVIYPEPGVDPSVLRRRVQAEVDGVVVMDIGDMQSILDDMDWMVVAEALLVSACFLALLAGSMPIVNTMMVSVADQTREIGVKRALGASAGRIIRDVLAEAALIGALGGVLGALLAVAASLAMNEAALADGGAPVFTVAWEIVGLALAFSVVVGVLGGLYPAWRVSRMDPVDALAHE